MSSYTDEEFNRKCLRCGEEFGQHHREDWCPDDRERYSKIYKFVHISYHETYDQYLDAVNVDIEDSLKTLEQHFNYSDYAN